MLRISVGLSKSLPSNPSSCKPPTFNLEDPLHRASTYAASASWSWAAVPAPSPSPAPRAAPPPSPPTRRGSRRSPAPTQPCPLTPNSFPAASRYPLPDLSLLAFDSVSLLAILGKFNGKRLLGRARRRPPRGILLHMSSEESSHSPEKSWWRVREEHRVERKRESKSAAHAALLYPCMAIRPGKTG
jgi:hypothetical protein